MIAASVKRLGRRGALHWGALALLFLWLSIDELAGVHEMLNRPLRAWLGLDGLLYYAWVLPGAAGVLLLGISYWRFVGQLSWRIRALVVAAGFLFVAGALGVELAEGLYRSHYGHQRLAYALLAAVEETLEMLGVVVFIHALLEHLGSLPVVFAVRSAPTKSEEPSTSVGRQLCGVDDEVIKVTVT